MRTPLDVLLTARPEHRHQWVRIAIALGVVVTMATPLTASAKGATTLPPCPVVAKWPLRPVTPDVVAVLKRYYGLRHLTPISIPNNRQMILSVREQSVGVHYCKNPGGGTGGYVGVVPLNATAAVMVFVKHKPYPVTQAPANFVTLAKLPVTGWKVVGEGTGP